MQEKDGGAARGLTGKYGSAVSATRSKALWAVPQPPCGGRDAGKGLSDGMECPGREPGGFYGALEGTDAE